MVKTPYDNDILTSLVKKLFKRVREREKVVGVVGLNQIAVCEDIDDLYECIDEL